MSGKHNPLKLLNIATRNPEKLFQGIPIEEATTSVRISLPSNQGTDIEESKVVESDYNVELGVYHENEISGQIFKGLEFRKQNKILIFSRSENSVSETYEKIFQNKQEECWSHTFLVRDRILNQIADFLYLISKCMTTFSQE